MRKIPVLDEHAGRAGGARGADTKGIRRHAPLQRRWALGHSQSGNQRRFTVRGAGRAVICSFPIAARGILNIIYGVSGLDNANVYVNDTRLIFDDA